MPDFFYRARNTSGKIVTGHLEAPSVAALKTELRGKGYLIIEIKEEADAVKRQDKPSSLSFSVFSRITQKDLAIFSRQFATLIAAGIPISRTLNTLASQTKKTRFRLIIHDILRRVEGGESLAKALERHNKVFNKLYTSLVMAGEVSGTIDVILARIAAYLEKEVTLKNQIRKAVSYPIFVLSISLAISAFLLMFIVPMFANFLAGLGTDLPLLTKIVVNTSHFLTSNFLLIVLGLIAVMLLFSRVMKTQIGRRVFDNIVFHTPVFGPLYLKVECSRFSRTLASMSRSGVPVLTSLEIIEDILSSVVLRNGIRFIRNEVRMGQSISDSMRRNSVFPLALIEMIAVGEETGHLDEMLDKSADYYDDEIETTVGTLSSLIEPTMIVIVGGIVGFVIISMYLPIFKLYQSIVK